MRLRVGTPVWLVGGPPRGRRYPTLIGNHEADVAIVGGGMTGAGIAHEFTAAGLRVVLVDADLVGRGSTAASTALLMQETDEELGSLAKRYGAKRAARIWELSGPERPEPRCSAIRVQSRSITGRRQDERRRRPDVIRAVADQLS
jgi:glycine/D-amino acid oxidase-like deaminating enzyme